MERGARKCCSELIETHLKLVVSVAEKHLSSGMPMLDLLQEGNLGLMNAVRSFAAQPGGEFSSYATTRIEESITKAIGKG
jgi:RNA polymerase primary sigma factor